MRNDKQGFSSVTRVYSAFRYSLAGLRHAAASEAAFQQELIFLAVLSAACIALPFGIYLKVQLLAVHVLILIAELLNCAIEALADKISREFDPLIKQAKDTASAAVLLAFIPAFLLWGYALSTLI